MAMPKCFFKDCEENGFIASRMSTGKRIPLCYKHYQKIKQEGVSRVELKIEPNSVIVTG